MPREEVLTSQVYITLDGEQVDQPLLVELAEVSVDQHAQMPDMATLRFRDSNFELLDGGRFDLTKELKISAENEDGEKVDIFEGEIVGLEPIFEEGMNAELVVRAYDKSHRLYRETKSRAFLNKKDSDLAQEIAQAGGLQTEIETTSQVYEHIYQHNQTDLDFLRQRAWRIGYECFVSAGKLTFRKPKTDSTSIKLAWGEDLTSFQPQISLSEQVEKVVVRGWDVEKLEPIVGQASNGRLYPKIGESKDGAAFAKSFGTGKRVIVNQSVANQEEANKLAEARLDEASGAFVEAEGRAFRRPDIRAGGVVELEALGRRLSGKYYVTQAVHTYSPEGFQTEFTVRGTRSGSVAEQIFHSDPMERWLGTVTAVVTDTADPQNWNRVKLYFPWMSPDAESTWARVVSPGAGPEVGLSFLPEVGDEVLVAFEHGNFNHPYVLGGLWNGKHKLPPAVEGSDERPLVRTITTRKGHALTFHDTADNKIELLSGGGHKIVIDDANQNMTIISSGGHEIVLDDSSGKITLKSSNEMNVETSGNLNVKAGANLKIEATGNMDLQANGQVNIKGAMINLN